MGKRKQLSRAPATSAASLQRTKSAISKDLPLHRGRKKRQEAKRRLEQKKSFIESELERLQQLTDEKRARQRAASKKAEVGSALAVFGEIGDTLPAAGEKQQGHDPKTKSVTRHRQRRRLVAEESEQARNVVRHEAFKADPVEALRQHLMNTVSNDPCEIPPPLAPGTAGAPKKRRPAGEEKRRKAQNEAAGGLVAPDKEAVEKLREEARLRVARKKEEKAAMADAAQKLSTRKKSGKIEQQTLGGLLGRGSRGRIGVKRPKIGL